MIFWLMHVAARVYPPFVMNEKDQFLEISVFLWDNVAEKLDLEYNIEKYGLNEIVKSFAQDQADIALKGPRGSSGLNVRLH